jgi:hypothetical protein
MTAARRKADLRLAADYAHRAYHFDFSAFNALSIFFSASRAALRTHYVW